MLPTPGTRIPAVVDRLVAIHGTITGLQVLDGAHIGEVADSAVCVGVTLGGTAGYSSRLGAPGRGGRPAETWTVRCFLSLASGYTDMSALRVQVGEHLAAIATALADERVAEGVWDRAQLGPEFEWMPVQDERGAICSVLYEVSGAGLL